MSHILKIPTKTSRGVISFTSQEEGYLRKMNKDTIDKLRKKWVFLMHANAWNHDYTDDDFFEGFLSIKEVLKLNSGNDSKILEACCMNFSPAYFESNNTKKVYDVMAVSRYQKEKNVIGFFKTIRLLFNMKKDLNVILVMTVPGMRPFTVNKLRSIYETMFTANEQKKFELISIDYNGAKALNRKTLAIIYNASKIYLSTHTNEIGGRVVAYARAASMPVVSSPTVANSAKSNHRQNPYFYAGETYNELAENILKALNDLSSAKNMKKLDIAAQDFLVNYTLPELKKLLITKYNLDNEGWQNDDDLEIKIAKHNSGWNSDSTYFFNMKDLIEYLYNNSALEKFDEDSFNKEMIEKSSGVVKIIKALEYTKFIIIHKTSGKLNNLLIALRLKQFLKKRLKKI